VNYDNSLLVTITVTCYSWAPFSGDHFLHVAPSTCRHKMKFGRLSIFR